MLNSVLACVKAGGYRLRAVAFAVALLAMQSGNLFAQTDPEFSPAYVLGEDGMDVQGNLTTVAIALAGALGLALLVFLTFRMVKIVRTWLGTGIRG